MDRVILVGIDTGSNKGALDYDTSEMQSLLEAADKQVVMVMMQSRRQPDKATYIGKGKVEELVHLVDELQVEEVVFNADLSPTQVHNLEERLDIKVVDRTLLILEIFNQRAYSREGKLQVELATLQYQLPRLTGRGESMSRLGGGIGARGAGEQQLELDRRHIRKRIQDIKIQLDKVEKTRRLHSQRRQRVGLKTVSLVGYTNAGKSSLFNALCRVAHSSGQAQVEADDRLFQTLDITIRSIKLPSGKEILISDTVGFVSNLPHHLIAAFRSTLKETLEADLLLHVVDRSDALYLDKMQVVNEVIEELDAGDIPRLIVLNKTDRLVEPIVSDSHTVPISALAGSGINLLLKRIDELI